MCRIWRAARTSLLLCLAAYLLTAPSNAATTLLIEVLAGEGAVNSTTTPNVIAPKVRVRDQAGKPVAGAHVRFEIVQGAERGSFPANQAALDAETNAQGVASAPGYSAHQTGAVWFRVTAALENQSSTIDIHQRNGKQPYAMFQHSSSRRKWILIGAAAVTGGVLAIVFRPKSDSTATINLGSPTVGGK